MLRSRSKTKSARLKVPSGRADLSHTGTCGVMLRSTPAAPSCAAPADALSTNGITVRESSQLEFCNTIGVRAEVVAEHI